MKEVKIAIKSDGDRLELGVIARGNPTRTEIIGMLEVVKQEIMTQMDTKFKIGKA